MKYLFANLQKLKREILNSASYLIMLDFDGTLSPIVSSPNRSLINKTAKRILKALANKKNVSLAIISGRSLQDLKNKVGIKKITYAGNHGMEWEIQKKQTTAPVPSNYRKIVPILKKQLAEFCHQYKGTFLEDKGIALTLHYRRLNPKQQKIFREKALAIIKPYLNKKTLKLSEGKKVLDITPQSKWNKGKFALYLKNLLFKNKNNQCVVYIGDDTTDEDVFRVLPRGITIRVGKKNNSSAKYFLKNVTEVSQLLTQLNDTITPN
jgi:trehalose 6-phosphate phosphatase